MREFSVVADNKFMLDKLNSQKCCVLKNKADLKHVFARFK